MKEVVLFIPVCNEKEALTKLLAEIPKKIFDYNVDIVIVDDGSTDGSPDIASSYTEHVVSLCKNFGVGFCTRLGFEYIVATGKKYRFVIKMDGDGQHKIKYLPEIITKLEEGADIVICSRFHPDSPQKGTPLDRMLLNSMFSGIISQITKWQITDARSGYMGFQYEYIKKIASQIIVRRYGIPMEIILRIWAINPEANVEEIPHPAIYGGQISQKLRTKYETENKEMKSDRVREAYLALLNVLEDLKITTQIFC